MQDNDRNGVLRQSIINLTNCGLNMHSEMIEKKMTWGRKSLQEEGEHSEEA